MRVPGTQALITALPSALLAAGAAVLYFTLLSGPVGLWDVAAFPVAASLRHGIAIGALCILAGRFVADARKTPFFRWNEFAWSGLVFLFLGSDWLTKSYNFFQGPLIRGELLLGAICVFALLKSGKIEWLRILLPLTTVIAVGAFYAKSGNRLLFSDDLTTFYYRLQLLKETFPAIPFYNPQWNGGLDQRDFFATGALNVFFLTAPILYLTDLLKSFNWLVMTVLFVITPAASFLAARILGVRPLAQYLAAALSMAVGLCWYRWAMQYGTLGFVLSCSLFPLVIALTARFIEQAQTLTWGCAAGFCAAFTLMLFWSPSGAAYVPAVCVVLCFLRTALSKRQSLPAALLIILLNAPWLFVFWSVSKVGNFIEAEKPAETLSRDSVSAEPADKPAPAPQVKGRAHMINLKRSLNLIRETAVSANPLLLILIIPGIAALKGRTRILFAASAAWLFVLGAIIAPMKPQFELDRMLVMLLFLGTTPSALAFCRLIERIEIGSFQCAKRLTVAALGSFFVISPFAVGNFMEERTFVQYWTATDTVDSLTEAIKNDGGEGRVLFTGCILHELSGGHLAPLAIFTGKPLMASSHVHNLWWYRQIIPRDFLLQGDAGVERYFDLYNVTAVITHEPRGQGRGSIYFSERPELYTPEWKEERFALFKRKTYVPTYFLDGKGELLNQDSHSVTVKLDTPDATIKFNYFPFLTSTGCTISPARKGDDVSFIHLSGCATGTPITIQSKNILGRLAGQ